MELLIHHLVSWSAFPYIIVLILFVLVIVSIFGNIGIDWSTKKFTFGTNKSSIKRSCKDCIMLLLGKRTQYETMYNTLKSNILRDQMTYSEHKLQEIKYLLESTYKDDIDFFKQIMDIDRENKEIILYKEILSNALYIAKDEIRRSMRENGFHKLTGEDFKTYIFERSQILITIIKDYIRRNYPITGMIVPLTERFRRVEFASVKAIENNISDIYVNAKDIRNRVEDELSALKEKIATEIDELIKS